MTALACFQKRRKRFTVGKPQNELQGLYRSGFKGECGGATPTLQNGARTMMRSPHSQITEQGCDLTMVNSGLPKLHEARI